MSPFLFLLIQEEMGGLGRQLSKAKTKRERERGMRKNRIGNSFVTVYLHVNQGNLGSVAKVEILEIRGPGLRPLPFLKSYHSLA